jgi:glycerol-3-phosphate O-acyltransferase
MTVLADRLARLLRANGSASVQPPDDGEALLGSNEFSKSTAELASQLGRDVADVRAEATAYVREMAATHVPAVVRAWHAWSAWMVRGFQVVVDDDDLAKLRELDRDHALIFLISHRSYLD